MPNPTDQLARDGFAVVDGLVPSSSRNELTTLFDASQIKAGDRAGLERTEVRAIVQSAALRGLVAGILGEGSFAVRATLFDKTPCANWFVAFHQDATIRVASRREAIGFTAWSVKDGVVHVRPPRSVLESMLAVRIELDGSDASSGALRVIHTPGHTPGNVALHAAGVNALLVGDTLSTLAVTTGNKGPQISPFTADPDEALASLSKIEDIEAGWLLPGHGAVWQDGVASAVAAAREFGVEHLAKP